MKKSQLRKLIKEVINEYESSEIIPGIRVNDEGEYDIEDSVGKSLYNNYLKNSSTIGTLVGLLMRKGVSEKHAFGITAAIDRKYTR